MMRPRAPDFWPAEVPTRPGTPQAIAASASPAAPPMGDAVAEARGSGRLSIPGAVIVAVVTALASAGAVRVANPASDLRREVQDLRGEVREMRGELRDVQRSLGRLEGSRP